MGAMFAFLLNVRLFLFFLEVVRTHPMNKYVKRKFISHIFVVLICGYPVRKRKKRTMEIVPMVLVFFRG